jgi:Helix-turn-helix domain
VALGLVPMSQLQRIMFTPAEVAAACGRHPSWCYRLLYSHKIKAITGLGRTLIPASELDRLLGTAEPYNPQPNGKRKARAIFSGAN